MEKQESKVNQHIKRSIFTIKNIDKNRTTKKEKKKYTKLQKAKVEIKEIKSMIKKQNKTKKKFSKAKIQIMIIMKTATTATKEKRGGKKKPEPTTE